MNKDLFSGVFTALATPMSAGNIAFDDLEKLIAHQLAGGIDGLVSVGTTGESPTITHSEHIEVIHATVRAAGGKVPVFAGTGSNATEEAIKLTREAEKAGADGFLLVAPYYNKPSQEGLFRHFSKIAENTEKPIILYSIPSRCGVEISVEVTERLHKLHPNVCCMKAAEGSCEKVTEYVRALGDDFAIMSGDDSLTLPFISTGATGVVSVASNLLVKPLVEMVQAANNNDFLKAQKIFIKYHPLFKALFIEPNPAPIKYALMRTNLIASDEVRLPLTNVNKETADVLDSVLKKLKLDF